MDGKTGSLSREQKIEIEDRMAEISELETQLDEPQQDAFENMMLGRMVAGLNGSVSLGGVNGPRRNPRRNPRRSPRSAASAVQRAISMKPPPAVSIA